MLHVKKLLIHTQYGRMREHVTNVQKTRQAKEKIKENNKKSQTNCGHTINKKHYRQMHIKGKYIKNIDKKKKKHNSPIEMILKNGNNDKNWDNCQLFK